MSELEGLEDVSTSEAFKVSSLDEQVMIHASSSKGHPVSDRVQIKGKWGLDT